MATSARVVLNRLYSASFRLPGFMALIWCFFIFRVHAQDSAPVVELCEVLQSPDKFDKQTIQLRGVVHLAFEDFTFHSDTCPNKWPGIWLAFSGDAPTPTMSTANDTVRPPGVTPRFEGVSVSLTKDEAFERFFALISARHGSDSLYHVTATLTGTFLAGRKVKGWPPGYGHLGASYLFVITHVNTVNSDPPPQVNVAGTIADQSGTAVPGVQVYAETVNCCQPQVKQTRTDDSGHFSITNAGQVLTFTKAGYRPQSVVLEKGRSDLHLTLESTSAHDWQIAACKETSGEHRFKDLPLNVFIPNGLHTEQLSSAPDSPFIIHAKPGFPFIRLSRGNPATPHGQTASWIFSSEKFSQRNVMDSTGRPIGLDSKGETNSRFWRILAMPGQEIVEYHASSRETAELFDTIIDSACIHSY
ncbi:MAG TPA: carboxypeptidase-like regulatory domain-containing protein [Candidatus Baltobacteraceae bacterium]|nr:carboxypeptidase-like regulatory domain-containing protein [Candidatus Baltobacteraceae bacterium]